MSIFVPPAVFGEVKTVFDSPVVSYVAGNVVCSNPFRVQARNEIAGIAKHDLAIVGGKLTINTCNDLAIWQLECFANVMGVI
ncbi:MAG: hypothetical protein AAGA30_18420 [Planctomycetota bacterium]